METKRLLTRVVSPLLLLFLFMIAAPSGAVAQEDDGYLAFAEKMPEPVGGLPAIYKNIEYPNIAKKAKIEGKVYLLAYVDKSGKVTDVKVIKGLGGGCQEAAIDGIKKSKFNPGENQGQKVDVKLSLAITFKLN